MHVRDCPIDGLKIITLTLHRDARGLFVERFSRNVFAEAGLPTDFVQDNFSRSAPNVLRGLHYQVNPGQGKLVGVTRGRILDVAVDLRNNSLTFGRHHAVELTGDNGVLFWIPDGFAHGFCVLGDESADVSYKVTSAYHAGGDRGLRYDDPELGIDWPLAAPFLSARDAALPSFAHYRGMKP